MEAFATKIPNLKVFGNTEEKDIVRQCLNGNERAQYKLYRKYVKAMYHTIVRMVSNEMDAEDLTQELFIKVFKNLHTFKGDSTLGAWIKRIAINTTLNFLRNKRQIHFMDMEDQMSLSLIEVEKKEAEFDVKKIHEAIKQLPAGCRVIFNLYLMEGYRHKEIAEILDISESTSKTQYRRAKKLLQTALK